MSTKRTRTVHQETPVRGRTAAVYEAAKHIYFVSEGNRELVRSMLATPLLNSSVISNPFAVSYNADPPWPADDSAELRLACVGRLYPSAKGQDLIFAALADKKWRDRAVSVTLYGNGPDKPALEASIKMYNLQNARFGGYVHDIEAIWAKHHALILPSRYEGLPIAVIEAMICNRACIVTDIAGNAEHIEDNVTGFVAPGARIHYVDDALERCWQNRSKLQEMGKAAGSAIRARIPADPILDFTDRLESVIDNTLR